MGFQIKIWVSIQFTNVILRASLSVKDDTEEDINKIVSE
jgi:hypothetical protein